VLGLSYADGAELVESARKQETKVHAFASTLNEVRPTKNVIADTKQGDPDHTLVVGSHLDSVVKGPGINDDGSGTATDLEIAETLAKDKIKPRNRVRFAFWAAEESGLVGLDPLRREPEPEPGRPAVRQPELRHARVAELRAVRVRR
jgi:Zn-dependent M28 family amino/carboxypeptidase